MIFDLLHVRIRTKLLGLVLLPVVGGGLLSGLVVAEQTRLLERLQNLRAASSLSASVGNLVHALQAESADTALLLGSRGARFQDEVRKAREVTDRERAALDRAFAEAEARFPGLVPVQGLDGGRLKELRRRADRGGAPADLADRYAREVGALVHLQEGLMLPAAGTPLESRFKAFATLTRAKESAGAEAAALAGAAAQGTFEGGLPERLQVLQETQRVQGEAFQATAPAALGADLRRALAGPFAADLQRLRQQALADHPDVEPEAWTRTALAHLDALQGVQERMARGLLEEAASLEGGARTKGWLLAAGFGIFGLVVLLWTWRATMLITEPIQALAEAMARLKEGDLRIQLPVQSWDETGRMTEAFNAMSARLRELVHDLQVHAARVASGATGLSTSADQVGAATQQLARSSRVQRLASEEVSQAVAQLQTSVLQVRASLDAMVDGGRAAGEEVLDAGRRLRTLVVLFHDLLERSEPELQEVLREGEGQAASILQALSHVEEGLAAIEVVAGEIHRAAEHQSQVSGEVSRRMEASRTSTGEVQLAAAQLANTVPEVTLTTKDLVQVAQSLKTAATAFHAE